MQGGGVDCSIGGVYVLPDKGRLVAFSDALRESNGIVILPRPQIG